MLIDASPAVREKIRDLHDVEWTEVEEAFFTSAPPYPFDKRPRHKTKPPTQYFIAETFDERLLKVCFTVKDDTIWVKSAFDPEEDDVIRFLKDGGIIGCL
jgi:hypothetical protein